MIQRTSFSADPEPVIRGDRGAVGRELARQAKAAGFSVLVIEPDGAVWRVVLSPMAEWIGDLPTPPAGATPPSAPPVPPSAGGSDA